LSGNGKKKPKKFQWFTSDKSLQQHIRRVHGVVPRAADGSEMKRDHRVARRSWLEANYMDPIDAAAIPNLIPVPASSTSIAVQAKPVRRQKRRANDDSPEHSASTSGKKRKSAPTLASASSLASGSFQQVQTAFTPNQQFGETVAPVQQVQTVLAPAQQTQPLYAPVQQVQIIFPPFTEVHAVHAPIQQVQTAMAPAEQDWMAGVPYRVPHYPVFPSVEDHARYHGVSMNEATGMREAAVLANAGNPIDPLIRQEIIRQLYANPGRFVSHHLEQTSQGSAVPTMAGNMQQPAPVTAQNHAFAQEPANPSVFATQPRRTIASKAPRREYVEDIRREAYTQSLAGKAQAAVNKQRDAFAGKKARFPPSN